MPQKSPQPRQLQAGLARESLPKFRTVVELSDSTFSTIQGLDPKAGAQLNIGHALHLLDQTDKAVHHWLIALHEGSYEYAVQAMDRIKAANQTAALPSTARVGVILGDKLAKVARVREAAVKFSTAYLAVRKDDGELTAEAGELREMINDRMDKLAEVWDDEQSVPTPPKRPPKKL